MAANTILAAFSNPGHSNFGGRGQHSMADTGRHEPAICIIIFIVDGHG